MTHLFPKEKVRKFFNILERLNGGYSVDESKQIYKGYDKNNPHIVQSQRDVFVNRTINKWLIKKHLVIYRMGEMGYQYKQYAYVSSLYYANDWSTTGHIKAHLFDYANPNNFMGHENITYNDAINLEGEWTENSENHIKIMEMLSMMSVPDKEYVFIAYDMNKYPKRKKKGVNPMELIKTTISVKAKTEQKAYRLIKEIKEKNENPQLIIGELIENRINNEESIK